MDAATLELSPPAAAAGLPSAVGGAAPRALRLLTAGSVDDGKSTLIGRLLHDSRAILSDQYDALRARSDRSADALPDLSLLTDGLEAEREQGITIDVAHRYFATPRRKFVIADAPGHEQYTRNMVTAATNADCAVVLVDLTKLDLGASPVPLLPQTRRHALLAQLLRVPHVVFAVNKIDAVGDPAGAFAAASAALTAFAHQAGIVPAGIVPVSALRGDHVTDAAPHAVAATGYRGPSLLALLESLPSMPQPVDGALALPVQHVARAEPGSAATAASGRTYWGRVAQGRVRVGDAVAVFPSGQTARVAALRRAGETADAVPAGESAGVVLDTPLDVSRGDWLAAPGTLAPVRRFAATLAWLDNEPAVAGRRYWVRHGHAWTAARLVAVAHRLDIATLARTAAATLGANDIGRVVVELQQPLPLAPYAEDRTRGALVMVDTASHRTSGALMVEAALPDGGSAA